VTYSTTHYDIDPYTASCTFHIMWLTYLLISLTV